MCLSVYLFPVPSKPGVPVYKSSTESAITLSWNQSGFVDNYIIESNGTETTSVSFTGVGSTDVSVTVSNLQTSGALYCITVTAVSGHLHSGNSMLCNYTGKRFTNLPIFSCTCAQSSTIFVCTECSSTGDLPHDVT